MALSSWLSRTMPPWSASAPPVPEQALAGVEGEMRAITEAARHRPEYGSTAANARVFPPTAMAADDRSSPFLLPTSRQTSNRLPQTALYEQESTH